MTLARVLGLARRASNVPAGSAAKASLVGAKRVYGVSPFNSSTNWTASMAVVNVLNSGRAARMTAIVPDCAVVTPPVDVTAGVLVRIGVAVTVTVSVRPAVGVTALVGVTAMVIAVVAVVAAVVVTAPVAVKVGWGVACGAGVGVGASGVITQAPNRKNRPKQNGSSQ